MGAMNMGAVCRGLAMLSCNTWTCVAGSPECENAVVCPCDLSLCRACFNKRLNRKPEGK